MTLQNLNILNTKGVKKRILNKRDKLSKLMLISTKYFNKPYYILDDNNNYIGTLSLQLISNLNIDFIEKDPILSDVLKVININTGIYIDETTNIADEIIKKLQQSIEDEVILIDKNSNKIICITNNLMVSSVLGNNRFDKPYFVFGKKFQKYNNNLNKYSKSVNSQHGEDGVIEYIFNVIGTTSKYAVEFGGWDGVYLSNIRDLIINNGFSGLFIEGDSNKISDCQKNYSESDNVTVYEAFVGFEGENTLDNILKKVNAPKEIDIISIDIDGYDYHVWEALKEYKPRVIIIEINHSIDNDIIYINPRVDNVFKGSSAAAMVSLGVTKGYSLIAVTPTNCIFVVNEEFHKFDLLDNSLEYLRIFNHLTQNKFFQTYNKELRFVTNCPLFIWDNKDKFTSDEFTFK